MTHAPSLTDRFRAATPSQRLELHAAMTRELGLGFANALRDLVESVERAQAETRARAAALRSNVIPFRCAVASVASRVSSTQPQELRP